MKIDALCAPMCVCVCVTVCVCVDVGARVALIID